MKKDALVLMLIVAGVFFLSNGIAKAADGPNIVFLMADDLGYGDLGCYNKDSKVPTPNFDRLARQGMRFTDAHTPSAVCTPTRYGVLTGRYCWRSRLKRGVLNGYSPALIEPGRATVASLLKERGYVTAGVGKWHLGLGKETKTDYSRPLRPGPLQVGFDSYFGIPASLDMAPYVYVKGEGVVEAPTKTVAASDMRRRGGGGFWRAGPIAPSFTHEGVLPEITRQAIAFLENHARTSKDQPFFLYFPLTAPHTPWMPTKEFRGKSGAGPYGDFTVQVDATVGEVMKVLDRLKLADNTLLIVTSDNGAHWLSMDIEKYNHRANGPLRGQKADAWEGGHRVPFLARWPGKIKSGSVSNQTICHVDLLATCADLVGRKLPAGAGEDSASILPVLLGKQPEGRPVHEAVVHHSSRGVFAIRQGDWKLIEGLGSGGFSRPARVEPKPGGPKGQLYNLREDPAEKENLYLKKPDVVERLHRLLQKYREQGYSVARRAKG